MLRLSGSALLVLALMAHVPSEAATALPHTDVRAVGSRADIHEVVQDSRGFLWTASNEGLCRFDGFDWTCPLATAATAVAPDVGGGVWALLGSGLVAHLDRTGATLGKWPAPAQARMLAPDGEGGVWVGGRSGLFRVGQQGEAGKAPITRASVSGLASAQGRIFAAAGNSIYQLEGKRSRTLWEAPLPVDALAVGADGAVVAALHDGALWQVGAKGTPPEKRNVGFGGSNRIRTMAFDSSRRLWVGMRDLLYVVDAEDRERTRVDVSQTLATYQFNTLLVDHEGSLWAGTPIGLLQLRFNHPLTTMGHGRARKLDPFTFAVTATDSEDIWSAHPQGLALWREDKPTVYGHGSELPFEYGRSLAWDDAGVLWVGDMQHGLFRRIGEAFTPVANKEVPWGVQSVRPRRGGGVWLGLSRGGLATASGDQLKLISAPRGDRTDHAMDLLETASGTLWIASSGQGLIRRIGDEEVRFGPAEGIPDDVELLCLAAGAERGLWIGTGGGGLIRFDGTRGRTVTTQHGLDHDSIYGLAADAKGRLWMTSPRGVSMVQQNDVEAVVRGRKATFPSLLFGEPDGLSAEPIRAFPPAISLTREGRVLVPTGLGVVAIDAQRIRAMPPPRLYVEDITIDGQRHGGTVEATAEVGRAAHVAIKVAAPTFVEPHRVRIEYRRKEDVQWITVLGRTLALENLALGEHQLLVRAAVLAEGTTVGDPLTVRVGLRPYWHARTSVRLGALSALLLLFYGLHKLRMTRMANTHAAVLADRSRIAHEIHDGLEQNLSGLRLQIEAAALTADRAPEKTRAHMERAGAVLDEAMLDLRTAIWGLKSSTTTTDTLFKQLSHRFRMATADTHVTFHSSCVGPSRNLAMGVATHLAFIAREAVANATKHGRATHIRLLLDTTSEREAVLEVSDDGIGVDVDAAAPGLLGSGLGLAGMRERARTIHGRIDIGPRSEGGTQVKVWVPV